MLLFDTLDELLFQWCNMFEHDTFIFYLFFPFREHLAEIRQFFITINSDITINSESFTVITYV